MTAEDKVTIHIVEDYALLRRSIALLINKTEDLKVIGDFETAEEFLEEFKKNPSDIVLMDLSLPRMNGITATKIVKELRPDTKVIVLTSHTKQEEVIASLACGANAYCLKDLEEDDFHNVIREVNKGVLWLHPQVAEFAKAGIKKPISTNFDNLYSDPQLYAKLTEREKEVLQKLIDGKTNTEIAQDMCISTHTAKAHVGNIFEKLQVTDRVEAAVKALRTNLID